VQVSVIIPTRNEAGAIGRVLADLPANLVTEVIVVDNNSTDGTPEIAARMGAQVVSEPRRGYGQACLTGLAHTSAPDVVVFLDGDYSDRPAELPLLLAPIADGRADITLGSCLAGPRTPGALPWHAAFGNRIAAGLITSLYGVKISDLGPFRAARAKVLHALALKETTYGWAVEMLLKGAVQGFRIVEVPVSYYPRIGKSKISGTIRGTVGAAWFILSGIVRYLFPPAPGQPAAAGVQARQAVSMESSSENMARPANRDCTLVIMAKAPRPGMVKTRLAQRLPPLAVIELYRCLLEDTLALAQSLGGADVAIMCPPSDVEDLSHLAGTGVRVVAQRGDGLAAGLTSVFKHFAAAGRRIIAFNSDSPHLPVSVLKSAFEALATCDVVAGPTHDGGYYLVGATASHPELFTGDGMGTMNALETLLARTRALGLSVRLTDPFYDIDLVADLNRLAAELPWISARAPRTAAWLLEWGSTVPKPGESSGHS
jgi:uncharacterized protein